MPEVALEGSFGALWRAQRERAQEAALPRGRVVVSCAAPLGGGGLGRHLQEIVDALDRLGQPRVCICGSGCDSPPVPRSRALPALVTPIARFSPGWRVWKQRVEFDAHAARRLPAADHLIAFNRQALAQFDAARRARYGSVSLMSGSPHVRRVARQHARAYRQYPLERSFGTHVVKRYIVEYARADRICVASRYTWESFVEQGVPEEALSLFPLTPDPRYVPGERPATAATFDVVYVGALTVAKGVPLLLDAFRRLPHRDMRLVLVGGWKARGMRRAVQEACARDPRIVVRPGDPLPHLRTAALCVHPTFEDGFAYAPAEALACGTPVLVTEDTGMKELVDPGRNGLILPTGDLGALTEAIEAAYRGEIFVVEPLRSDPRSESASP
jgi:glycosyltransferase involved in cell wall biosynthesis